MMNRELILNMVIEVYRRPLLDELHNNKDLRNLWLKELLCRMKIWASSLDPEITGARSFMFDVMNQLNHENLVDIEIVKKNCRENNLKLSYLDQYLISWWINWVENRIKIPEHLVSLANPFEPFEILLQLGGGYINRDGSGAFSAYNVVVNPSDLRMT